MRKIKEPVDMTPFLEWAERRAHILSLEHGAVEAGEGVLRLLEEMGWDNPAGSRRLHRWRCESVNRLAERSVIEDALHRAGYLFEDVYPDEPVLSLGREYKSQRLMTDEQVAAAHVVYVRAKLTMLEVATLVYEKYGYGSPHACRKALSVAFKAFGLPARACTATATKGGSCTAPAASGADMCLMHAKLASHEEAFERTRREGSRSHWPVPESVLLEVRVMHDEWGMSFRKIAAQLLDEMPHGTVDGLAKRLAMELKRPRPVYALVGAGWEQVA